MTTITSHKITDPAAGTKLQEFLLELLGIDAADLVDHGQRDLGDVGILGVPPTGFSLDTGSNRHLVTIPVQLVIDNDTCARILELLGLTGQVMYTDTAIEESIDGRWKMDGAR